MKITTFHSKRLSTTSTLTTKSKLNAVIGVKLAQCASPMLVISNFTAPPKSARGKIAPLLNENGLCTIV